MTMRRQRRWLCATEASLLMMALLAAVDTAQAQINVRYYRGTCTVGFIGSPCNLGTCVPGGTACTSTLACPVAGSVCASVEAECGVAGACGVTPAIADDVTELSWAFGPLPFDIYRGRIPSIDKAALPAGGPWTLNITGCFLPDLLGGDVFAGQVVDPNPPPGAGQYYVHSEDGGIGGLPNTNVFGCAVPGVCNNLGWCELGATPGAPCNAPIGCLGAGAICAIGTCVAGAPATLNKGCFADADCGLGGVCRPRPVGTFCSTDAGPADLGGCARHATCAGGPDLGRLCITSGDCPLSTCPSIPDNAVAAGQFCYNLTGPGFTACPVPGNPKRLVRVIPAAVIAACP